MAAFAPWKDRRVAVIDRSIAALRTLVKDPIGRRGYLARLKWLATGTEGVQAWSLEYRAGLRGEFTVDVERLAGDDEIVSRCPADCSVEAPLSHLYEQRFVYRLPRTVANTASGATLFAGTEQPPFFVRESITWPFESILSHGLDVPTTRQVGARFDGTTVVFPTTQNYYHWLIEDLPVVLRAAALAPDARYVAFDDAITERHHTVAKHLHLRFESAPLVAALDEQVLPGRSDGNWFVHPVDARLLHDFGRSLTGVEPSRRERIYVSRRFSRRSLPNEELLESRLAAAGFRVLHLESMPWAEQIAAFQQASVVVGPHGAGLANLVFTESGATVVEIVDGMIYNRCYEWICHTKSHDYRMIGVPTSGAQIEAVAQAVLTSANL